jgi:hypothetical protein
MQQQQLPAVSPEFYKELQAEAQRHKAEAANQKPAEASQYVSSGAGRRCACHPFPRPSSMMMMMMMNPD